MMDLLFRGNIPFNKDSGTSTANYAAAFGSLDVLRYMHHKGADLKGDEDEDACGNTPLLSAAENGHVHVVRYLLELGAHPNVGDSYTPFIVALDKGHLDVLALFIEHCRELVDLNTVDAEGRTIAQLAYARDHNALIKLLESDGGSP